MLSLPDILLLVLCARSTLGGPVRRYLNATSTEPLSSSTKLASLQADSVDRTSIDAYSSTTLASLSSNAPAQPVQKEGGASSSDLCESMEGSTSATASALLVSTTVNGQLRTILSTKDAQHAKSIIVPSAAGNNTESKTVQPYGGHRAAGGYATSSTTTMTFYTTVPPHGPASSSQPTRVSSGTSSHGASSYVSYSNVAPSHVASSSTVSSSAASSKGASSHTGGRGIVATSSSAPAYTTSSEVGTKKTKHHKPTSKPAVWGSLTLTYPVTTKSNTGAITLLPSSTSPTRKTRHRKPTKATPTQAQSSSAFAYPLPGPSKQGSSSSATVNPVKTSSAAAPSVTYSYKPTDNTTSSLPPVVTQQTPSSSTADVVLTASSSTSIAGITIVPVNPDATTIYMTVTTTDAGMTTTIAAQTVTSYA